MASKGQGIVRKIDELGRLVIPMEYRRERGWGIGTPIEMLPYGDYMLLQPQKLDKKRPKIKVQKNCPIRKEIENCLDGIDESELLFILDLLKKLYKEPQNREDQAK